MGLAQGATARGAAGAGARTVPRALPTRKLQKALLAPLRQLTAMGTPNQMPKKISKPSLMAARSAFRASRRRCCRGTGRRGGARAQSSAVRIASPANQQIP